MSEKEHACRERDDARTIANEKLPAMTSSQKNDWYGSRSEKYKDLQEQYKELQDKFSALQSQVKTKANCVRKLIKSAPSWIKSVKCRSVSGEADRGNAKPQAKLNNCHLQKPSPK